MTLFAQARVSMLAGAIVALFEYIRLHISSPVSWTYRSPLTDALPAIPEEADIAIILSTYMAVAVGVLPGTIGGVLVFHVLAWILFFFDASDSSNSFVARLKQYFIYEEEQGYFGFLRK